MILKNFLAGSKSYILQDFHAMAPLRFARRFDKELDLHTMKFQLNRWGGQYCSNLSPSEACGKAFHSFKRRS